MTATNDPAVSYLHESNAQLSACLSQLCSERATPIDVVSPGGVEQLLTVMLRAGECLRRLPEKKDSDLERELAVYRSNMLRLRDLLPSIHEALLRERARLEQQRSRIESAAEWARGSQQTL